MCRATPNRPFVVLLAAFPDLAALARQMDQPYQTIASWKRRDSIPERHWRAVAEAAKRLGARGVSHRALSRASDQKRGVATSD